MSISTDLADAIIEGDLQGALDIVQKASPEDLHIIITTAEKFPNQISRAVIALAKSLLRIADLEKQLAEAKKQKAEAAIRMMREKQATPPTPDEDDTPSPF
ncbi:hypothetical protein [Delftia tsuruhatensis]|uniref:hypothetical protein n=1 Tax=Delftia tsuruhatensis TaxID=180282 RepID=UPI0020906483|nr:hypothetical protein [Delftia tsuruhatensis]MCO5338626.1 hypothetical protein [Delftia tsuruhatensis]MCR4546590.1 hypothetical protein [Delftia tsuruhatensis]